MWNHILTSPPWKLLPFYMTGTMKLRKDLSTQPPKAELSEPLTESPFSGTDIYIYPHQRVG